MLYIERKHSFIDEHREILDNALKASFPYFLQPSTENFRQFAHVLSVRHPSNTPVDGVVNSIFYDKFKEVFLNICNSNGIKVNTILRSAINCTYHASQKIGDIHIDHNFPHNVMILYMNDFTEGSTLIFNDHDEIIRESSPEKDKYIIFSGEPHAQRFCAPGELRATFVVTFV